jgi:hypothetical protein
VLRVPVAVQLTGVLATDTPAWYVPYQGLLGVAQFGIGLTMTVGYRRAGPWGGRLTPPAPVRPARDRQRRTPAGP